MCDRNRQLGSVVSQELQVLLDGVSEIIQGGLAGKPVTDSRQNRRASYPTALAAPQHRRKPNWLNDGRIRPWRLLDRGIAQAETICERDDLQATLVGTPDSSGDKEIKSHLVPPRQWTVG